MLEEIAEAPYKVDRLIQQLIDSGGLEGAVGLAIGEFRDCDAPVEADWTIRNVIEDKLAPLGLPVVEGLPVGHGPSNRPWRVGEVGTLGADGLGQSRVG